MQLIVWMCECVIISFAFVAVICGWLRSNDFHRKHPRTQRQFANALYVFITNSKHCAFNCITSIVHRILSPSALRTLLNYIVFCFVLLRVGCTIFPLASNRTNCISPQSTIFYWRRWTADWNMTCSAASTHSFCLFIVWKNDIHFVM